MVKVVDDIAAPKRKRFNKNKKKAWRKKANISEAEENLEEERRQERYGGPLEEREDMELMFLDVGDGEGIKTEIKEEEVKLEYTLDKVPVDTVALKPRKQKRAVKIMKSHQFINGLPGAKMPRKPRPKQDTLTVAMKRKAHMQAKDPRITKKSKNIVKDIEVSKKKEHIARCSKLKHTFDFDAWSEADAVTEECKKKGVEDSFIQGISRYYQTQLKLNPVTVPRFGPTSTHRAVEIPFAGQSYNPSYKDHQNLLRKAVKQEKLRLKGKQRDQRYGKKGFPTKAEAPTEETWINEMSEGLPKATDDETEKKENEEGKGDCEEVTVTSKAKIERKTKRQRKKEKKKKIEELKKAEKKEERIRGSDLFKIKTIQKEVEGIEKVSQQRILDRLVHQEMQKFKPRRLGKLMYQPEDIAVQLGHNLPDSLRHVKPAVPLIEDRFKSLQRRNILESRLRHKMVRKHKVKKQMKRGHREAMATIEKLDLD